MNGSKLYIFLKNLEYGTNLHISVVFLNREGNSETSLPFSQNYHSRRICDYYKSLDDGVGCLRCRNIVLKRVIKSQKSFGGLCVNGIYEFCHPVIIENRVVCVVFIGNILPPVEKRERLFSKTANKDLISDLQEEYTEEQAQKLAEVVDSYIKFLLKEYKISENFNPLIENIKSYIEENLTYDFAVSDISKIFNYNEKYIGKLFKRKTGSTIKEYLNLRRIGIAEDLLKKTYLSVTDVATRTGFNNVTYFNRVFKQIKGMTPSEYRK